ncbi:DUF6542 domain-containing protein [Corynebacterium sp. HMSC29G08]|uniref:DUF6542 domain-containing protein n=1 Tax=Corynebacterium sp. HMSC29G08 TaxID=1581069 RepID=UPI0008A47F2F|nr:DUF6542 domain-containing protein [Corynebacterium sp. HMSC29G08]
MSYASKEFVGLPTGSAIGINFAALLTAVAVSVFSGGALWPCGIFFALSLIATTLLVNPRGIFLTVATAPLLFAAAATAIGVLGAGDQLSAGGASSRAAQLLVVYPLVQLFPWLATLTVIAAVLGWSRVQLIRRQNRALARTETRQRIQAAASNRKTTTQGRRARERATGRQRTVSVDELLKRERSANRSTGGATGSSTSRRLSSRLGDDLYSN